MSTASCPSWPSVVSRPSASSTAKLKPGVAWPIDPVRRGWEYEFLYQKLHELTIQAHDAQGVYNASLSPDGGRILACGGRSWIGVWDAATGSPLLTIDAGADEALMLDPHAYVSSCNATNFFCVRDGEVLTSSGEYCFNGVTRANVIHLCERHGVRLRRGATAGAPMPAHPYPRVRLQSAAKHPQGAPLDAVSARVYYARCLNPRWDGRTTMGRRS